MCHGVFNVCRESAFEDCTGLTEINIPDSVEKIEDYAFYGCSSLTKINIPERVAIGENVFEGCKGLTIQRV